MTTSTRGRSRVRIPLPRWIGGLAALVVGLELLGWGTRILDVPEPVASTLSMEAPFSVPRLAVAGLFLTSALAAAAGAQRLRGRRAWWASIAVVTMGICAVKTGGTVHTRAVRAIGGYEHPVRSLVVFGGLAVLVIGWLYWLSRFERRDRRRVLAWLAGYAFAAVVLSTLSAGVAGAAGDGSVLTATATLIEEAGEAVSAVGVLFAVLVGVAPKLVLPRDWVFSRPTDAGSPTAEGWAPPRRAASGQ